MSILLPSSDDEPEASDTPSEVEADSPCSNRDESPRSRPRARLTLMTRDRVSIEMPAAKLYPQASSRVTNVPVSRLLTNAQRRSHHEGTASVPEAPLAQPSQAKTKGAVMKDVDTRDEATDEASSPSVKA